MRYFSISNSRVDFLSSTKNMRFYIELNLGGELSYRASSLKDKHSSKVLQI